MLYSLLEKAAAQYPETIALFSGNNNYSCTYYELNERVKKLSYGLLSKCSLKAGDRIASYLRSCPEALELLFACLKIGVTVVVVHPYFGENEIRLLIEKSQPKFFVTQLELYQTNLQKWIHQFSPSIQGFYLIDNDISTNIDGLNTLRFSELFSQEVEIEQMVVPVPSEQEAMILFTSGTTGRSKCVQSSHHQHLCAADQLISVLHLTQKERFLLMTPMNSFSCIAGCLLPAVRCAATMFYLPADVSPTDYIKKLCSMIYQHNISCFLLMTSIFRNILKEIEQHEEYCGQQNALRCCLVGGERIPEVVYHKAKELLGLYPTELYGLTEINGISAVAVGIPCSGKFQSIGDKQIHITDDNWNILPFNTCGEITIWSTTVMIGYLNDEEITRQILKDGWLKTGDLGILEVANERDVYLTYVGRKKLIIKCDGFNVNLLELEEAIINHKAIFEVCVVGIPFKTSGEKPIVYISLRTKSVDEETNDIVIQEIFSYLKEKVAIYKIPLHIKILDSLPKTVSGKIDRNTLAQRALNEFAE